ncbi:MAG: HI0074 family nucleotidyltransferase substrate-binding subunit [Cyclonatronaceae bacterium]
MSEKADKLRQDLMSAIRNLTQLASSGLDGDVEQDAFIKRFELAYELSWKWLQARIMAEGITVRSPRQVFKESVSLGYIQNEEGWLEMIEVRNVLVHTYNADKAREYTGQIRDSFLPLFTDLRRLMD